MATILLVDDDAVNRKLLVAQLSAGGYLTKEAAGGEDALRIARETPPDLVISDVVMPTMDGYGFVRALRLDASLSDTPVIFYTAYYHHREAQNLASACGVTCVLAKPSSAANILKAVEQVLAGVRETEPDPLPLDFDREHLRLVVDKLTEQTSALVAYNLRYEMLSDFSAAISEIGESVPLLQYACRGIRTLIGARYAVIAVTDERMRSGVRAVTCGVDFGNQPPPAIRFTASQMGSIFASRVPWRAKSTGPQALSAGLPKRYPAADAFLAVPLLTAAGVYGWICLADKIGAEEFSPEDERLLCLTGTIVGCVHLALSLRLAQSRRYLSSPPQNPLAT